MRASVTHVVVSSCASRTSVMDVAPGVKIAVVGIPTTIRDANTCSLTVKIAVVEVGSYFRTRKDCYSCVLLPSLLMVICGLDAVRVSVIN